MKKPQAGRAQSIYPQEKEQRRSRHIPVGVSRVVIHLRHLLFPSLYYSHCPLSHCHNCCSRISYRLEPLDINGCLLENNTHQMNKSTEQDPMNKPLALNSHLRSGIAALKEASFRGTLAVTAIPALPQANNAGLFFPSRCEIGLKFLRALEQNS